MLEQEGFTTSLVDIRGLHGLLHLKSGIAFLGENRLLLVESLIQHEVFRGFETLRVPDGEEYAANCVRINEHILVAAGYPETHAALVGLGYQVLPVEMSEFRKMDGGLSCLSLRF